MEATFRSTSSSRTASGDIVSECCADDPHRIRRQTSLGTLSQKRRIRAGVRDRNRTEPRLGTICTRTVYE